MLDLNHGEKQTFDLIPEGTICKVAMSIKPGGVGDGGWLTQSQNSDAQYLNGDFVVVAGPYARKHIFQVMVVSGGKTNERGESKAGLITMSTLRAMVESARGIDPNDMSENAMAGRRLNSYGDLSGMEFAAKIGIEKGKDGYEDKNKVKVIVTPDKGDVYRQAMNGVGVAAPVQPTAPQAAPAWQTPAKPAAPQQTGFWQPPNQQQASPPQPQQPRWGNPPGYDIGKPAQNTPPQQQTPQWQQPTQPQSGPPAAPNQAETQQPQQGQQPQQVSPDGIPLPTWTQG